MYDQAPYRCSSDLTTCHPGALLRNHASPFPSLSRRTLRLLGHNRSSVVLCPSPWYRGQPAPSLSGRLRCRALPSPRTSRRHLQASMLYARNLPSWTTGPRTARHGLLFLILFQLFEALQPESDMTASSFNCLLPAFSCAQYADCNSFNGQCSCPAGFGGVDCIEPRVFPRSQHSRHAVPSVVANF